jgi:vancomycin resistance protein VanJ
MEIERQDRVDGHRPGGAGQTAIAVFVWLYLVAVLAAWTLLYTASDRWWPATAILFAPRWLGLIPAVVLVPAAALSQRQLLWPLGATLLFLLGPFMGLCVPLPGTSPAVPTSMVLRVLTCNVHYQELDADALAALLADSEPDIVVLQEWRDRYRSRVFAGKGWHIRTVGELCLASRYPIGAVEALPHASFEGGMRGAVARFELETPVGHVQIVNVHLDSPHHGLEAILASRGRDASRLRANSARRRTQSREILRWLQTRSGPLLLAGDFNMPPDSTIYRECWSRFTDAFAEKGLGFGWTFFSRWGALRIDHILAGSGWHCRRCWVGPNVGSAHRPVLAELAWPGPPMKQQRSGRSWTSHAKRRNLDKKDCEGESLFRLAHLTGGV